MHSWPAWIDCDSQCGGLGSDLAAAGSGGGIFAFTRFRVAFLFIDAAWLALGG
jgi:hypothetical protein